MKWTIRKKLLAGFMGGMLLSMGLGLYSLSQISAVNHEAVELGHNWLPAVYHLGGLRAQFNRLRSMQAQYLMATDGPRRADAEERINKVRHELKEFRERVSSLVSSAEERQLFDTYAVNYAEYEKQSEKMLGLAKAGKTGEAQALFTGTMLQAFDGVFQAGLSLTNFNYERGRESVEHSNDSFQTARAWIIGMLCFGFILCLVAGLWLADTISRPVVAVARATADLVEHKLLQLTAAAKAIAAGDLSQDVAVSRIEMVKVTSKDEVGQMTSAFNTVAGSLNEMSDCFSVMTNTLRESISQISNGSDQLTLASSQIAAASDQSRRSSDILSSSSEEITATVHQMASSVKQVSNNAQTQTSAANETSAAITEMVSSLNSIDMNVKQLSQLTSYSDEAASVAQRVLHEATENLQYLHGSVESAGKTIFALGTRADSIGQIVEAIADIAEQTNLLALNAAIEAARAGEHGLGFAVVADEVRKLAVRSARSTKEISELVGAIQSESRIAVTKMDESNSIVRAFIADTSVHDSLTSITAAIHRIVTFTREIEFATSEQSTGAEQVARATQNLSQLTHEISAATEEQSIGAAEVVRSMEQMRDAVQQAHQMSGGLQTSAEHLYQQAEVLQSVVKRFNTGLSEPTSSEQHSSSETDPFKIDDSVLQLNGARYQAF